MRVLPSPVRISAMLPPWSTIPPMSCTSKCRMPIVRRPASRTSAKHSSSTASSSSPSSWTRSRRTSMRSRSASSVSSWSSGSKAEMRSTRFWYCRNCFASPTFSARSRRPMRASVAAASAGSGGSAEPSRRRPRALRERPAGRAPEGAPRCRRGAARARPEPRRLSCLGVVRMLSVPTLPYLRRLSACRLTWRPSSSSQRFTACRRSRARSRARRVVPFRYRVASATFASPIAGLRSSRTSTSRCASSETCRLMRLKRRTTCSRSSSVTGTFRPLTAMRMELLSSGCGAPRVRPARRSLKARV